MGTFLRRWWRLVVATVLLLAAFQVFLRPPSALRGADPLRDAAAALFRPAAVAVDSVRRGALATWRGYIALGHVARENEALRKESAVLRETIRRDQEAIRENGRLKELLRFSETVESRTVGARVVGHDISPWFHGLYIDAGSEVGIEPGMAVVTPAGGVGRIHKTSRGLSEVLLLTDGRFAADVLVERSRVRAVAEGIGGRLCSLKYVSLTRDVVPGDQVLFSGFDGSMPKGTLLGTVVGAERPSEGLFQHVRVVSTVDFRSVEEVLVVLTRPSIPFRAGKD